MEMRQLINLVESKITEIERGASLEDDWEDQEGEFAPEKLGVPGKEDPNQPKLFPDEELPRRVKPGASPFGDSTPMVQVGNLPNGYAVARPRTKFDDEDSIYHDPMPGDDFYEAEVLFVVFDDITPVGYVRGKIGSVSSEIDGNGGSCVKVSGVRTDKAYLKRGIALMLYAWMMKEVADYIEADDIQSDGGVRLWEKMVLSPQFEVLYEHPYHSDRSGEVEDIETVEQLQIAYDYDDGILLARLSHAR